MGIVDEVRHLDGLKGNFMVNEKEYLAPSSPYDNTKPTTRLFYSNLKDIVEQQQPNLTRFYSPNKQGYPRVIDRPCSYKINVDTMISALISVLVALLLHQ
jgi:hypothetical protein